MSERLEMDSNLVSPAGRRLDLEEADRPERCNHPPGGLGITTITANRHLDPGGSMPADRLVDRPAGEARPPPDHSFVEFGDLARLELGGEMSVRRIVLGHHQNAGRIAIEAVHDTGSLLAPHAGQIAAVV